MRTARQIEKLAVLGKRARARNDPTMERLARHLSDLFTKYDALSRMHSGDYRRKKRGQR